MGYRITPRALADLDAIADYSLQQWGASRTRAYLMALENRFAWLARNPKLGQLREDIRPGFRSFPQVAHVIFYVIARDGIDIIGVPLKAMDMDAFFDPDGS